MKRDTKFTHLGRPDAGLGTAVNHSVTRASTLLFDDAADLYRTDVRGYGRHGCSVHDALSNMFTELEGGAGTTLFPSGLLACTIPILSQVKTYDPRIGAKIEGLVKDNTRLIILESPGSLTFEIQDIPAIVKVAKAKSITTSDIMYGAAVSASESIAKDIAKLAKSFGNASSPDDAYQILRGFRTIMPRFRQQEATALELATRLESRPEIQQVLHPALEILKTPYLFYPHEP